MSLVRKKKKEIRYDTTHAQKLNAAQRHQHRRSQCYRNERTKNNYISPTMTAIHWLTRVGTFIAALLLSTSTIASCADHNDNQNSIPRRVRPHLDRKHAFRDEQDAIDLETKMVDNNNIVNNNKLQLSQVERPASSSSSSLRDDAKTQYSNIANPTTLRGSSSTVVHRQTRDVEDMLNEMSDKQPQEWSVVEWVVFVIFLSFLGCIASCLCVLCCCDNLLGCFCLWEMCCRGGRDIDACCDYGLAC